MELEVGGIKFTGGRVFAVLTALSTAAGIVWGAALFWQDYTAMKNQIQSYVAPDLSAIEKRLAVTEENSAKAVDYTRDIKNDLKVDLRKIESVVETIERDTKNRQREMDKDIRELREDMDLKIKKALENPLAQMGTAN